jgi:hypothetical protein
MTAPAAQDDHMGSNYDLATATDAFLDRAKPAYIGGYVEMVNARLYPFWGLL